jgi:hypothetical protein
MSYVKTNVAKSSSNAAIGGGIKENILLFDWDDVTGGYTRDSKGIVITGPLVFKAGRYAIKIEATQETIKASSETSGESDAEGIIQTVEFMHPGDSLAIREFSWNWLGRRAGIIIQKCSDDSMKLYGAPCAPLKLSAKEEMDKDKNTSVFTFKQAQKGPAIANYLGTVTLEAVMGTIAVDAHIIPVAAGAGEYQLSSGSIAAIEIDSVSGMNDGEIITLLGSGGLYPSTIEGTPFMLASGAIWTGLAGASITFKAFKDSPSTFIFIELARS